MHKTYEKRHNSRNSEIDIYDDIEKIKAALMHTSVDLRGKAGEIINESLDSVKEKSELLQENLAQYTSERPIKSLGIALIAGVALGFLLRR